MSSVPPPPPSPPPPSVQHARVLVYPEMGSNNLTVVLDSPPCVTKFNRRDDEDSGATLARMAKRLGAPCALCGPDGTPLSSDVSNAVAFSARNAFILNGSPLPICVGLPRLLSVKVALGHGPFFVGCPILPSVTFDFVDSDTNFLWAWERDAAVVGTCRAYTPVEADIGRALRLHVTPRDATGACGLPETIVVAQDHPAASASASAPAASAAPAAKKSKLPPKEKSSNVVAPFPGFCEETRARLAHCHAYPPGPAAVRVATYNILLDAFCDSPWALQNLYPNTPADVAKEAYRAQLATCEIAALQADFVCLQEVSAALFSNYLQPRLALAGLTGHYANKITPQPAGNAVFVADARWGVRQIHNVDLTTAWRLVPCTVALVEKFPRLQDKLECTTSSAQVLHLQSRSQNCDLVLVNTHLFSHPYGSEIRVLQVATILQFVATTFPPGQALLFCGDFNAELASGCVDFLEKGVFAAPHPEWAEATCYDCLGTDTKEERETNWHAVLRDEDFARLRRVHAQLGAAPSAYAAFVQAAARLKVADAARFLAILRLESSAADAWSALMPPDAVHAVDFPNATLSHTFKLTNALPAMALHTGQAQPVTFFAGREPRGAILDHVFFSSDAFALRAEAPAMPGVSTPALEATGGLPAPQHPSDHVAQVVDFDIKGF